MLMIGWAIDPKTGKDVNVSFKVDGGWEAHNHPHLLVKLNTDGYKVENINGQHPKLYIDGAPLIFRLITPANELDSDDDSSLEIFRVSMIDGDAVLEDVSEIFRKAKDIERV